MSTWDHGCLERQTEHRNYTSFRKFDKDLNDQRREKHVHKRKEQKIHEKMFLHMYNKFCINWMEEKQGKNKRKQNI